MKNQNEIVKDLSQRKAEKGKLYNQVTAELKGEAISDAVETHRVMLERSKQNGRVNLDSVDEVRSAADEYMKACAQAQVIPTMLSFSACMGHSRQGVYRYISTHKNATTDFLDALRSAWAGVLADLSLKRSLDCSTAIFLLKNSGQGLQDRVEISATPVTPDPLGEIDEEALRERIIASVVED